MPRSKNPSRNPVPEEPPPEALPGLEESFDFRGWMRNQARRAPYGAVALVVHLLLLVVLMSVTLQQPGPSPDDTFSLHIPPPDNQKDTSQQATDEMIQKMLKDIPEYHQQVIEHYNLSPVPTPKKEVINFDQPLYTNLPVKLDTHNESASDDPFHHEVKGEGFEFRGTVPLKGSGPNKGEGGVGQGIFDTIGVGGGAGGSTGGLFGGRFGGKENLISEAGGNPNLSEVAVGAALRWLAIHQDDDGGWSASNFSTHCVKTICGGKGWHDGPPGTPDFIDVGVTGLSLLAFLGAGYTHESNYSMEDPFTKRKIRIGDVVRKAILFLKHLQSDDGCFPPKTGHYIYAQAIASLAMAEAYGLTHSLIFKDAAQKGIDYLVSAQTPYKGWRYIYQPPDQINDTSVTGWAVMALKSAKAAGLSVPLNAFSGALSWIKEVTDAEYYLVGYTANGETLKVVLQTPNQVGINDNFTGHNTLTGVGMLIRMFADEYLKKTDPDATKIYAAQAKFLDEEPPKYESDPNKEQDPTDYYYWYYGTLALYLYDAPKGKAWRTWQTPMLKALLQSQKMDTEKDGHEWGSWDPVDRWGMVGGRVYATALNALTLETYYRYRSIFLQRKQ